ncbi:Tricorn protease C1 domain-containing protein [Streptomyces zhaozhouensis]|uniref:Tricorn protease C1 domain-containing protein n=1 Tax=Streptomyces zhaozhouensis TaxID=1300267 RepID=A0A286DW93_9ACTN|nr:S41 family peptidase [Streptomyces zhaozhouensis]SOD62941.1 Tricorn protease C1 domain-containing protein [Streptomyces zhaozhouensis]
MAPARLSRHARLARPRSRAALLALSLAVTTTGLAACAGDARGADAEPFSPDGVWTTDGYGTLVEVEGDRLRTYDVTTLSCLPGLVTGERAGEPGEDGGVTFASEETSPITVTPDGANGARWSFADSVGDRALHRLEALPENCGEEPAGDPVEAFDVFWQTYAEQYPFFEARGVDWEAVREEYRPRVTEETTEDELFALLREMIEPLHDAHTSLASPSGDYYAGHREDTELPDAELIQRIEEATAESVGAEQRRWANGAVSYADMADGVGYLRITSFTGYTDEDGYAEDVAELDRALDEVFTEARTEGPDALRGLVLDLRFNGGGSDRLGLHVASRLTDRPYVAYTKHARNDPDDPAGHTPDQEIRVEPFDGPTYDGPVAVLTSRLTISAAETTTQSLLGREPGVTLVGENTQGSFSDTLDRTLPGGWSFALPNEEFLTEDGRTFDIAGIPPAVATPVFTDEEFEAHRDSALTEARALLGGDAG